MVWPYIAVGGGLTFGAIAERYGIPTPFGKGEELLTSTNKNVEQQAYAAIRDALIKTEGYRNDVYKDTRGFLTVGIGHLVTKKDNLKLGQVITNAQVEKFFKADSDSAFKAAVSQAKELGKYNADMIVALTEVNFQLGPFWRSKFPNTWSLLKSGKKDAVIRNLKNSAWNRQTPVRVQKFAEAIQRNYA